MKISMLSKKHNETVKFTFEIFQDIIFVLICRSSTKNYFYRKIRPLRFRNKSRNHFYVEEARSEWVSTGKYIARSFAEKLMKSKKYKDTSHLVREEMHEEELLNAADLDELQAVYGDKRFWLYSDFLINVSSLLQFFCILQPIFLKLYIEEQI